jgi:hypothetical protein
MFDLPGRHGAGRLSIFPQTYLVHRLINPSADVGAAAIPAMAVDVRLSMAATNSARFPFISPAGEIVPPGRSQPVDRIVDGGYLENFGVLSGIRPGQRDTCTATRAQALKSSVGVGNGRCSPSIEHIRVWPIARSQGRSCTNGAGRRTAISMSWWSSKPVQLRLVAELDRRSCNRDGFEAIRKALSESGSCAAP